MVEHYESAQHIPVQTSDPLELHSAKLAKTVPETVPVEPKDIDDNASEDGVDVSDNSLIIWPELVREMQPKFFKKKPRDLIESYVYSFLINRLSPKKVQSCVLASAKDGTMQYAIPDQLVDDFEEYFEEVVAYENKNGKEKPIDDYVSSFLHGTIRVSKTSKNSLSKKNIGRKRNRRMRFLRNP